MGHVSNAVAFRNGYDKGCKDERRKVIALFLKFMNPCIAEEGKIDFLELNGVVQQILKGEL